MNLRNFAIWGVILLGLVAVYAAIGQNGGAAMPGAKGAAAAGRPEPITYSQLMTAWSVRRSSRSSRAARRSPASSRTTANSPP